LIDREKIKMDPDIVIMLLAMGAALMALVVISAMV
jgi:preprotein translocase subunit Sec61beta